MKRALILAALIATPALAQAPKAPRADPAPATPSGETWELDQVRVARDVPEAKLDALTPDHSLDAVMQTLTKLGIPFTRGHAQVAPDNMPPELRKAFSSLPEGEPFIVPEEEYWSISVIVARHLPPGSVRFVPSFHFAQPRKA